MGSIVTGEVARNPGLAFGYDAINMVLDDAGLFGQPYGGSGSFNFGTLLKPRLGVSVCRWTDKGRRPRV